MGYPSSMNTRESSISLAPHEDKNRELGISNVDASREFNNCRFVNVQLLKTSLIVVVVVYSQSDWQKWKMLAIFFNEREVVNDFGIIGTGAHFSSLFKKREESAYLAVVGMNISPTSIDRILNIFKSGLL